MQMGINGSDIAGSPGLDLFVIKVLDGLGDYDYEEALEFVLSTKGVLTSTAPENQNSDHLSPVQNVPGIVAVGHTHVPSASGNRRETRARELPGPGDHVPLERWSVPNYIRTPEGHIRVLERINGVFRVRTVRGTDANRQDRWKPGKCNSRGECSF